MTDKQQKEISLEPIAFILGLAPSITQFFDAEKYCLTAGIPFEKFGVNDICRYTDVDYLICIDHKHVFARNRQQVIEKSTPKRFVSHHPHWSRQPNFEQIQLTRVQPTPSTILSAPALTSHSSSTYVAIQYAARRGYKKIITFGVDVYGHKVLDTPESCAAILTYHERLRWCYQQHDIQLMVGNESSLLSKVLPVWKPTTLPTVSKTQ